MIATFKEIVSKTTSGAGVVLHEDALQKFATYYAELLEWNNKINLTTITRPDDVAVKHFFDSIIVLKYVPLCGSLVDIGTGAGFPGIPLKILLPELSVVLIEAVRKKASFLKQVIGLLKLEGVEVYNGRMESFDRPASFDYAVSRAFSGLDLFCNLAAPVVKPGGTLIAMKGGDQQELAAVQELSQPGCEGLEIKNYALPLHKGDRSIIILRKCFT